MDDASSALRLFATIPPPTGPDGEHGRTVRRAARLGEAAGFEGALIYTDNNAPDPWVVAQEVHAATERFAPLVALQPAYMHPYTVARKISSYALMYGRSVCLNLVAGGLRTDLASLDDITEHDERYDRLTEYAELIIRLLESAGPVTYEGRHYRVRNLRLYPALPAHLRPGLFISGSSPAGRRAGERLGAVAVRYPEPPGAEAPEPDRSPQGGGVRIGVIARETDQEAWDAAFERFPANRAGRIAQTMSRNASDSQWLHRLSDADEFPGGPGSPYWMGPFRNYSSFCPYLVGSHEKVAAEVARYIDQGCRSFIMDVAREDADYEAMAAVFHRAAGLHLRQRAADAPV
jgi:alkanesulfonate monooxygenase